MELAEAIKIVVSLETGSGAKKEKGRGLKIKKETRRKGRRQKAAKEGDLKIKREKGNEMEGK